jgi:NitT/TauT family transport system substrate-binding protein
MAAEQIFGPGKHDVLDKLTVSLSHPDATAAILSGQSEITSHFTSAPFYYQQIASGKARKVLSSYDVLGGPGTFNSVWTTSKFREQNPKTYKAVLAALDEAMAIIGSEDKRKLAQLYIDAEKSRLSVDFVEQILKDPDNVFTTVPQGTMKYADFMTRIGAIKEKAASWKDYYFPEIHDRPGS